jgi:YegS/Rv2252/BmrU family lipid kinase
MKACLIVNPNAGPIGFQKQVRGAATHLSKLGCEVKRVETKGKGDATHLAQQAAEEGFNVAVAVGGDGTINEVCNGLAGTETALGVLPAGTANVYAADMRIPIWHPLKPDAVIKAAKIIVSGQRRRIDLGRLRLKNGTYRYFLMWCGIGLDAAITQTRNSSTHARHLSYAAWVVSGLIVAYDFMGTPATITTDDGVVRERVLVAIVSNGQLYGRIWRLAPEAKMDDGLLDVGIMAGHRWPSTLKHLVGLTFRQHIKDPDFHLHRTTHLLLSAKEVLPVHVDGETVGTTPVEIDVAPLALNVIIPQKAPARLFKG